MNTNQRETSYCGQQLSELVDWKKLRLGKCRGAIFVGRYCLKDNDCCYLKSSSFIGNTCCGIQVHLLVYLLPEQGQLVLHGVVRDVPLVGQLLDLLVHRSNL